MANKKILIVDDEKDVLAVLEKRLSLSGYSVIKAENGKEAVAIARSQHPDLVVLDIMMPGMDGGETAQVLKDDPLTADIPVIFLTCLLRREEAGGRPVVIGGHFFVAKPYNPEELLQEIKKHIIR